MGLLDDAIREHLDLKRRRGADPEEIERAEREALGPVRRGPDEAELVDAPVDPAAAYDHEGEQAWDGELDEEGYELPSGVEPELPALDHAETSVLSEAPAADPAPMPEAPPVAEPFDLEGDAPGQEEHERQGEHEHVQGAPVEPEPEPSPESDEAQSTHEAHAPAPVPAAPPPEEPIQRNSEETVEYDVEGALEEEPKSDEDVLEETPEFLQDTPDHDRLWFEQRPPRDFDLGD